MVNVDIDKELYESIKNAVQKKKYVYPSIKFFVQKAVYNEILSSKDPDIDIDGFYSRLKELLQSNPKLKSKVNDIHNMELKKIKKGKEMF